MPDETDYYSMRAKVVGLPPPRIALIICLELLNHNHLNKCIDQRMGESPLLRAHSSELAPTPHMTITRQVLSLKPTQYLH